MGAACPQGCNTPEDKSWTNLSAFLGESANLDEADTLANGYIENAVNFLVFKAEDAMIFKGKEGSAQHFINSVVARFCFSCKRRAVGQAVGRRLSNANDANDHPDTQGTDPINDVEKLKRLVAQLESKIKENFKRSDEILDWRARLDQVSSS